MAPYQPPSNSHYTELSVSGYPPSFMWTVIGKEGCHFYDLTDWLRLHYLWYDDARKVIEIWGPYDALADGAKDKINNIIKMYHQITCVEVK